MLKHPYYQYGSTDVNIPARLNFGEFILEKLWKEWDQDAFINGETDEKTTYGTICQQAMNFAVSLRLLDVKRGDTVGICLENRPEYWSVLVGIICTGATVTTLNPGYTKGELSHVLKISKPKYVIMSETSFKTHRKFFESQNKIKLILLGVKKEQNVLMFNDLAVSKNGSGDVISNGRLARNVNYEEFEVADVMGQTDTLFVLYSSGTSGLPKGVMLSHLNVLSQCPSSEQEMPVKIVVNITPWFHAMGLVNMMKYFANGRTVMYLPKFDVELFLSIVEKYKLMDVALVPPIIIAISKVQKNYDLSSVLVVTSGAAPLHKDTEDLVRAKFPNALGVFQGYGMTEATMALTLSVEDENGMLFNKPGSVGKPVSGATVKIVDIESRKILGPGQVGEICFKGIMVMKGYVGKDRSKDFDEDGFFKTGDVGYFDEDGFFFIVDRLKELIKYKGYQVAPAEIEAVLLQHEAVRDAGVIGVDDRSAGEVPMAFVALQSGKSATEKDIQDFVAERLSNPKRLRGGVRFVEAIPKNPSGKILRKNLRLMARSEKSKL